METILTKDKKQESQEIVDLLAVLNEKETQELKVLLEAVSFVKRHMGEFKIA